RNRPGAAAADDQKSGRDPRPARDDPDRDGHLAADRVRGGEAAVLRDGRRQRAGGERSVWVRRYGWRIREKIYVHRRTKIGARMIVMTAAVRFGVSAHHRRVRSSLSFFCSSFHFFRS